MQYARVFDIDLIIIPIHAENAVFLSINGESRIVTKFGRYVCANEFDIRKLTGDRWTKDYRKVRSNPSLS